jgi:hypothetical protein
VKLDLRTIASNDDFFEARRSPGVRASACRRANFGDPALHHRALMVRYDVDADA